MRTDRVAWIAALAAGILPLWLTRYLPFVDQPQHLHLISVLARLHDPSTLYPRLFELRGTLTPYVGYYAIVAALSHVTGLEIANKLFLSAYVVAMPLSIAFLLKSLDRPAWPSLLALPLAYGDNLAWGFVNYCAALPLTYVACGLCVRAMIGTRRAAMGAWLAASLVAIVLLHVMPVAFLVIAIPMLLAGTGTPGESWIRGRRFALAAVVPAAGLCAAWAVLRLGEGNGVMYGAPWHAWGPLLSSQNLVFKPFAVNLSDLPQVLANMLWNGADRYGFYGVCACAVAGAVAAIVPSWREESRGAPGEPWRIVLLAAIALGLFFVVPFDVRGYAYYVNTRYAQLAAPLILASVPPVRPHVARVLTTAAAVSAVAACLAIAVGFAAFNREARALDTLVAATAPRPMVMGLVFEPGSRVVTHPVYVHAACVLATAAGGATNFSFALTPHSPVAYRTAPPPTFPSEWFPAGFDYDTEGAAYDHFLVRGRAPEQVFGARLGRELYVAAQAGGFSLVRRR